MADGSAEAAFFSSLRAPEQSPTDGEAEVNGLDDNDQLEEDDEYDPPDTELPNADDPAPNSNSAVSSAAPTPTPESPQQPQINMAPTSVAQQPAEAAPAPQVASPPVVVLPKARLPHDRIGILEDRIAADERGDLQAWLELIEEQRRRGKLDEVRKVYDRFFEVFPMAVSMLDCFFPTCC